MTGHDAHRFPQNQKGRGGIERNYPENSFEGVRHERGGIVLLCKVMMKQVSGGRVEQNLSFIKLRNGPHLGFFLHFSGKMKKRFERFTGISAIPGSLFRPVLPSFS